MVQPQKDPFTSTQITVWSPNVQINIDDDNNDNAQNIVFELLVVQFECNLKNKYKKIEKLNKCVSCICFSIKVYSHLCNFFYYRNGFQFCPKIS